MVAVRPREIDHLLKQAMGRNTVFTLRLGGEGGTTREAMIRELQRDPVSELMLHIDFVRVDPTKMVHVRVPVRLIGTPEGVKNEGGIVDFVHRDVEVECLPTAIPGHLDVDISALHINQNVSVKDLGAEENVQVLDPPESIIAVVVAPKAEAEPTDAEEEAEVAEGEETDDDAKAKEGEGEGDSGEKKD